MESTLSWLGTLQKDYEQFPVLTRQVFADVLRSHVNLLASDDHVHELLQQLHSMGEVITSVPENSYFIFKIITFLGVLYT